MKDIDKEEINIGIENIKNEIMRFYITLNMEQDFIETIKAYHSKYLKEWEKFPENYLKISNGNRKPSKNSKHLEWLKEVGYFKSLKPTKTFIIFPFILLDFLFNPLSDNLLPSVVSFI